MSDALDRKMRAILEVIEHRNHKAAIKMINAAMVKFPGNLSLQSLKAHALERAGNLAEAEEVCEEMMKESPTDEEVQRIMMSVFRRLGKAELATCLYQRACAQQPSNETFLLSLFEANIREFDFRAQQQTVMKLLRLKTPPPTKDKPKERDFAWYLITVLFLQATMPSSPGNGGGMDPAQLLKLAESMALKQLGVLKAAGRRPALEQLLVYLLILLEQNKVQDALETVASALEAALQQQDKVREALDTEASPKEGGDATLPINLLPVQACLLARIGSVREAMEVAREAFKQGANSWGLLQFLFDCCLPSCRPGINSGSATPLGIPELDSPFSQSSAHVQEGEGANGHALPDDMQQAEALLEELLPSGHGELSGATTYENRASAAGSNPLEGLPDEDLEDATQPLMEAVLRYYNQLGHMPCCALDVRPYTARILGRCRQRLAQQVHEAAAWSPPSPPSLWEEPSPCAADALRRKVSAFQIENDLGLPEFERAEEAERHALEVMEVYRYSLPLVSSLDEKERGLADELLPLCASSLVAAARLSGSPLPLLQAVLALEAAQVRRRVSAPMRLSLMGLYAVMGEPDLLFEQSWALDIKLIMLDSISGHLLLPYLLPGAVQRDVDEFLQELEMLYEDHRWNCSASIFLAYCRANYTKAIEITKFSKRLEMSYVKAAGRAASLVTELRKAALEGLAPAQEAGRQVVREVVSADANPLSDAGCQALCFNADLQTRPAWLPPEDCPPGLATAAFWEQREPPPGVGRCWWSQPGAAQLSTPEAQAYRRGCCQQLQRTWLRLYILSHTFSATPADDLPGRLEQLRSILGQPNGRPLTAMIQGEPLHRAVCLLEDSILAAAVAFQGMSSGVTEASTLHAQLSSLARELEALCPQLRDGMLAESRSSHGLLLGGAWQVVVYAVAEPCAWLAVFLQVWFQTLKTARKAKTKKSVKAAPGDEQKSAMQDVRSALTEVVSAFKTFLLAIDSALPLEEFDLTRLDDPQFPWLSHNGGVSNLWNWEEKFSASAVLQKLRRAQGEVFAKAQGAIGIWLRQIACLSMTTKT
eukprot:jgi/Botrbrau1/14703/Bobra.0108s0056.1